MQRRRSDAAGAPRLEVRPTEADASAQLLRPVAARHILGMRVDATSYAHAADQILSWAHKGEPHTSAWPP